MTPEELKIIYDRWYNKVFCLAFKILKNESDAQDVASDVFIKAYKSINPVLNVEAYLSISAKNQAKDLLRKRKNRRAYLSEYLYVTGDKEIEDGRLKIEDAVYFFFKHKISLLPPKRKKIFNLYLSGLSTIEVCLVLGIKNQDAINEKNKATMFLKKQMQKYV